MDDLEESPDPFARSIVVICGVHAEKLEGDLHATVGSRDDIGVPQELCVYGRVVQVLRNIGPDIAESYKVSATNLLSLIQSMTHCHLCR